MGFIHDQLVRVGHMVEYFCAEDVPARWTGRLARLLFPVLVLRHAVAVARSGRPYDLINIHEPAAAPMATFKAAAGNPVVVVTSYGVEQRGWEIALEEARRRRGGPTLKTRLVYPLTSLWQSRVGLGRADHVFCLNSEDHDYLIRHMGVPRDRMTRIFSGADPSYATVAKGRDYRGATRLLFAGTWLKRKGIEDVVPAFETLVARCPELSLTVFGAGAPESTVQSAFRPEIRSRVSCVQTISDAETAAVFAAADVYLLPSLFEGTPLTLIEAMMSAMPIVTTATCGMKDVIQDGNNGLLVPIRSPGAIVAAVERLIGDVGLRARLGRAAQTEALEKYTWDRVAQPVRVVYEGLGGRRAGE